MVHNQIYLVNGSFEHGISPVDRGFAYGDGVFRTMRARSGLPLDWPQHYQKLVADCAAIGIVCPSAELLMSDFQRLSQVEEVLADKVEVIKMIITRGEGARGYAPPAVTVPTRVVMKSAMPHYAQINYQTGVQLHVCETRLAMQQKLAGIKHLNRLENVLARMEWREDTIFDGLMLDHEDYVIECTMSNIFARFADQLLTPALTHCGVAGTTRQRIFGLEQALSLAIRVERMTLPRLLEADEVVICNSLYGAFQVQKIQHRTWAPQALASRIRNVLAYD